MKALFPVMGFCLLALCGCRSSKAPPGPELERVAEWNANPKYTEPDGSRLRAWVNSESPVGITHTPEDRYLNGLAVCMSPFTVNWRESKLDYEKEEGHFVVRDVLVGGNPLLGTGRYACVLIPVRGIERVEFVSVRYHLKGLAKYSGHVQLRFVFKADKRPALLDNEGNPDYEQPFLDDLILSWEAWRPTLTGYSVSDGLRPDRYYLTARMYAGSQRFLQDSLRGAVWDCYPLDLPEHELAEEAVLISGLLLGDATARRIYGTMLEEQMDKLNIFLPDEKQLERLRGRLDWEEIPDHAIKEALKETDVSYHTFNRSCISLTHAVVDVAMAHLYAEHDLGTWNAIKVAPAKIPDWFDPSIDRSTWQTIKGAPGALSWILRNSELLPYKAYTPLLDAGVLETDKKGNPVMYRYGHKEASPYGTMKRNMM